MRGASGVGLEFCYAIDPTLNDSVAVEDAVVVAVIGVARGLLGEASSQLRWTAFGRSWSHLHESAKQDW